MFETFTMVNEAFTNPGSPVGGMGTVGAAIAILLLIVLELFVVQWLWNNVLVRVTKVVRPIPSLLYTLGLLILLQIVMNGC
jgi:hypothetical protein